MEAQKPKRTGAIVGGIIALLAVVGVAGATGSHNSQVATPTAPQPAAITSTPEPAKTQVLPAQDPQPQPEVKTTPAPAPAPKTTECGAGHYINSAGNCVQSPAYSESAPAGATAKCSDGTYSFSQSRKGTCSHHGGVAQWL
jgi:hypothetical protein